MTQKKVIGMIFWIVGTVLLMLSIDTKATMGTMLLALSVILYVDVKVGE